MWDVLPIFRSPRNPAISFKLIQHYCVGHPRHSPCTGSHMRERIRTYTNETGGILKEESKKRRGASGAMNIGTPSAQPSPTTGSEPGTSPMKWILLLQTRLTDCLTDTLTRCTLASLLEELGQPKEALCHWNAILRCDLDNLKAREGVARCRQQIGQPLQSDL